MRVGLWRYKPVAILLVVLTVTTIGYGLSRVATGNFHTVVPRELYRSGQMTEGQWAAYIQQYGIKSVLNLRGEHRASGWYQGEVRTAAQCGVAHYDVNMSAIREIDHETLETHSGDHAAGAQAAGDPLSIRGGPLRPHCRDVSLRH